MKARDLKNFLPERNNGIQTVYVQGFNACLDELAEKEIEVSVCQECVYLCADCGNCENGVIIKVKE